MSWGDLFLSQHPVLFVGGLVFLFAAASRCMRGNVIREGVRARTALVLALFLGGCVTVMKAGGFPPEARRKTPPAGLEQALDVGAQVPNLKLAMTDGSTLSLHGQPAALFFYRGHW